MLNELENLEWERKMRALQEGITPEARDMVEVIGKKSLQGNTKPTPMEILEDLMARLKAKFDEAVKGNDYVTILKYSEAITNVAKSLTDLQSSKAALDKTENMIAEMLEMLKS